MYICDNCGQKYQREDALEPIEDLSQRVDEGGPMPSGQCPRCGALCYPEDVCKRPARQTNEEFLVQLMNYSRRGALIQPFILTALEKYSQQVMHCDPAEFENSLVNFDAWQDCARETLEKLEKYYSRG